MHDHVAADRVDLVDGFLGALAVALDGEYFGAFLGKAHAGGAAVAPARADRARAGDDGDPVLETSGHFLFLGAHAGVLDDLRPLFGFAVDIGAEFAGRVADQDRALARQLLLHGRD